MILLSELSFNLPFTDPIIIFSIVLFIILFAPILLDKVKVPHLIGLIIAGIAIGPYGFHLLERDASIVLFGTVGLLYIMFMAGLEIDMNEFKKNTLKSILLGLYAFIIPITLGYLLSRYVMGYGVMTSVLLASTFASHTLVTYPLISKYGLTNNRSVAITVGATMVTDILTLLVLAVVVGMTQGTVNAAFWTKLSVSIVIASAIIIFVFPIIARWFFKRFKDGVSQFIFVLAMVFTGAFLAELAGIEGIIGAFLAGLSLNKFIPHTSALMNRIGFVGNAIFIPFFLVGVGMLVNIGAAFSSWRTLEVAGIMIGGALLGKYIACWLAEKTFKLTKEEGLLVYGLSIAQAAATLATVLVGYNVILGEMPNGQPDRLLDENILNGSILLILVSVTASSFITERAAKKIVEKDSSGLAEEKPTGNKTLISVNNPDTLNDLVDLGIMLTPKKRKEELLAVNVVEADKDDPARRKASQKMLLSVVDKGAGSDIEIKPITRFDANVSNGILFTCKEHSITDIIIGVTKAMREGRKRAPGQTTKDILDNTEETVYVYHPIQPFNTLKKIIVVVNPKAEVEEGFEHWVKKIFTISKESGLPLNFCTALETKTAIEQINDDQPKPMTLTFVDYSEWDDLLIYLGNKLNANDLLIVVSSRDGHPSYSKKLVSIAQKFIDNSSITIYPHQLFVNKSETQEEGSILDFISDRFHIFRRRKK